MTEFIISSEQLERLIEAVEHDTGREINRVVIDGVRATEIVRCADCKHYIDGECMVEDGNGDYLRLTVPPTHFCAWGEHEIWTMCKCGEEIELGDRESAVCPSCGRMVRE